MLFKLLKIGQAPVRFIVGVVSMLVPKKKGLIIFCSDRYNENSRYLFEYMIKNECVEVYWLAYNFKVTQYLISKNLPCLSVWWEQIWMLMRASVVVASGNIFWDRYGAVSNSTKKYCLMHGCGPKVTEYHDDFNVTIEVLTQINWFDYVNFPSLFGATLGANIYKLPRKKIVCNGYPRFDQLFSANQDSYLKNRAELCDYLKISNQENLKLILYSPTFRKYNTEYSFPIEKLVGYCHLKFDSFLKQNNIYIIYTKHPQSIDNGCWKKLQNCIYLEYEINPIFDVSYFLQAFDILINDYSTISVDFSILGRPQIFVIPDYYVYKATDGFNEEYLDVIVGPVAHDFSELILILSKSLDVDARSSLEFYNNNPDKDLRKYWSSKLSDSCKINSDFIVELTNRN